MDYGQTMHSWMICEDTYASKSQNRPDSAAASSREVTRQDSADVFAGISTCLARRFYAATVFEGLGSWNANLGQISAPVSCFGGFRPFVSSIMVRYLD